MQPQGKGVRISTQAFSATGGALRHAKSRNSDNGMEQINADEIGIFEISAFQSPSFLGLWSFLEAGMAAIFSASSVCSSAP